jgi:hypothetical protein
MLLYQIVTLTESGEFVAHRVILTGAVFRVEGMISRASAPLSREIPRLVELLRGFRMTGAKPERATSHHPRYELPDAARSVICRMNSVSRES